MTARDLRLDGRRVAVTRGEKPGGDPLASRLRELGAVVLEVPSIAIAPPASYDDLDAALAGIERFHWAAFASANAFERTLARARAVGRDLAACPALKLAAVGPATAARIAAELRPPDLVAAEARGDALAAALAPHVAGRAVLVPRAEEGRQELLDGLRRAGAQVVAPVAYRTVAATPEALAPLGAALASGELDAVAFASPSAVRSVTAALGEGATSALRRVTLAAIGPTTAEALRQAGLEASVVPERATAHDLADAIAERIGPAS